MLLEIFLKTVRFNVLKYNTGSEVVPFLHVISDHKLEITKTGIDRGK